MADTKKTELSLEHVRVILTELFMTAGNSLAALIEVGQALGIPDEDFEHLAKAAAHLNQTTFVENARLAAREEAKGGNPRG